ncbi:hypothetical protein CLAFUW4_04684 [Fulvia fulva]|uniref:Uncharacterized protein n=1 Tax=Passalora fulva TaxID=5499 RepID=A0A9Q8LF74_PASFU|nr:uncharacterized protein CLAFUR5_04645 [Fulvia fulva]KAK4627353.1 hypothetical protein CLAFUR4_04670 [Fulvia fulva]KAK4628013.1 hypothetical protein CLAFUR0_04674 [Fulvia fulva]UJO16446.1 hypothetical protein CLAFUR5_04645 [Fulvia fulva]WPV13645.1 hypothetical protein CLAFUW4_04684 [Fulvia fulva]WPV29349.1 hypothetical protein CLAFUW7_04678 [Fulvia fulva]
MVSAKLFSILGLASAATAFAVPGTSSNPEFQPFVDDLLAQNPRLDIWKWVQSDLDLLIPGVHCKLGAPASQTKRRVTSEDIQAIEDSVSHLFPEIECEGTIDWDGLQNSTLDLETRDATPFGSLFARQAKSHADISTHEKNQVAQAKASESKTVTDCASATRPVNNGMQETAEFALPASRSLV